MPNLEMNSVQTKLPIVEKSTLSTYVLGKAFLLSLGTLTHEVKVSNDKLGKKMLKGREKELIRLRRDFKAIFTDPKLAPEELEYMEKAIDAVVSKFW